MEKYLISGIELLSWSFYRIINHHRQRCKNRLDEAPAIAKIRYLKFLTKSNLV